ncbi:MAG: uracil phosphoribosyltransferase [Oscillospiraceae bacterium]|nr:uracil phosphoribosyltransferase [Oscillospiraceae bacterium]
MGKTVILDHPLIQHKISLMRDENTGTRDFRILVEEVAMLMGYEALRDLPTELVDVKTPVAEAKVPMLTGKKLAVVPILRAGLGMVDGILRLVPSAKVGHIGLYRDEVTHEPHEYYCKLPRELSERLVILPDPMLATGGSACQAVDFIKAQGCTHIKFMCVIAAPEGLKALQTKHPDIDIYVGCLDDRLNEDAYIVPGLGDAGDRIFGTK